MSINTLLRTLQKAFVEYLKPDAPDTTPPVLKASSALAVDNLFAGTLCFKAYDKKYPFIHLDEGNLPSVGFILKLDITEINNYGLLLDNLKTLFCLLPDGSSIQLGSLVVKREYSPSPMLATGAPWKVIQHRQSLIESLVANDDITQGGTAPIRDISTYLSIRVPFMGDVRDAEDILEFYGMVQEYMNLLIDKLAEERFDIKAEPLSKREAKTLLRKLLNPQHSVAAIRENTSEAVAFNAGLVLPSTRYTCDSDGGLIVDDTSTEGSPSCFAKCLTVDAFSSDVDAELRSKIHLSAYSTHEPLKSEYWVYTTMLVLTDESLQTQINMYLKSTAKGKVDVSKSAWHKRALAHMLSPEELSVEDRIMAMKAYTGITLFNSDQAQLNVDAKVVLSDYQEKSFRIAEEAYVSLFAHISAIPLQLSIMHEHPHSGFRRAMLMSVPRALSLVHLPEMWRGNADRNSPHIPCINRQGQLSRIDFGFENVANLIVSTNAHNRNFALKELLSNLLVQSVPVTMIEIGNDLRFYGEWTGIPVVEFNSNAPISINPFYGVTDVTACRDMVPFWTDMVRDWAYPSDAPEASSEEVDALIASALLAGWEAAKGKMELSHVLLAMNNMAKVETDTESKTLILEIMRKLSPLVRGDLAPWFKGAPAFSVGEAHRIFNLTGLRASPELLTMVMMTLIQRTAQVSLRDDIKMPLVLHNLTPIWKNVPNLGLRRINAGNIPHMTERDVLHWTISLDSCATVQEVPFLTQLMTKFPTMYVGTVSDQELNNPKQSSGLGLSQQELTLISRLDNTRHKVELFVKHHDKHNVFLIAADTYSQLLFSVYPNDLNRIDQQVQATGQLGYEIIEKLLKE